MGEKYYVVRVRYLKDGTVKKSELMEKDDENAALAKFHSNLGQDMEDETLAGGMCVVINGYGGEVASSYWEAK